MAEYDHKEYDFVQIFKALADETRLEIVNMLLEGKLCACKILERFEITQPTLSYHMKILTDCGLVCARKDGAWMHYSLEKDAFVAIGDWCERYYDSVDFSPTKGCSC